MKPQAELGGELADTQGNTKSKTFTSQDKYVGETASAIEAQFPGRVEAVNEKLYDYKGIELTEIDIVLDNTAIQVKSEGARGLVAQMQLTKAHSNKIVIGYAPDLRPNHPMIQAAKNEGFRVFTTEKSLLKYLDKN